jgi:hypothetical protein
VSEQAQVTVSLVRKSFFKIEFAAHSPVATTMLVIIEASSQTLPLLIKLGILQFLQSERRAADMELQLTQLEPLSRNPVTEQTHRPVELS